MVIVYVKVVCTQYLNYFGGLLMKEEPTRFNVQAIEHADGEKGMAFCFYCPVCGDIYAIGCLYVLSGDGSIVSVKDPQICLSCKQSKTVQPLLFNTIEEYLIYFEDNILEEIVLYHPDNVCITNVDCGEYVAAMESICANA